MFWQRRKSREHDLDRELRSHLEAEADERQENGLSSEEARYLEFGHYVGLILDPKSLAYKRAERYSIDANADSEPGA